MAADSEEKTEIEFTHEGRDELAAPEVSAYFRSFPDSRGTISEDEYEQRRIFYSREYQLKKAA